MRKSILWGLAGVVAVGLISSIAIQDTQTPDPSATLRPEAERSDEPSPEAIEAAKAEIKAEPKVRDFIYQSGQAVEWQIGVLDNGTSMVGYANYICELLAANGALKPKTHVRIVDIVKVSNGKSFRSASLGHIACADRRVFTP